MNQRIQELAEQAGQMIVLEINGVPILHYYAKGDGWVAIDQLMEKFAQLIVVECSTWVNDNVGLMTAEARTDLLKHFGVKE